jgi:transitional endoplasmic reticulum ATPase
LAPHTIWRRCAEEITDEEIELEALVRASDLFTPADIEFAAGKAAQRAFERAFPGFAPPRPHGGFPRRDRDRERR